MSRKPLIAGNWKMNLNHLEAISHVQKLAFSLSQHITSAVDIVVCPPFTDLRSVQTLIDGDKLPFFLGAQDVSDHDPGAYTGDIAASFLAKLGCTYVIIGHSERREYHHESNQLVGAKIRAALRYDLTPIVCVGETLALREKSTHLSFCQQQLQESLAGLAAEQIRKCVIAYEPIWAIGTGKVASAHDAEEICLYIRKTIQELTTLEISSALRILYGGSVSAGNSAELLRQANIDGALVGGASLKSEDFSKICAAAASQASISHTS